jgi:peptidoglycan/LPS O-acetylase OafA/YrhL
MERIPQTTDRVEGLDTLRFICAMWVFFGHGAAPPVISAFPDLFNEATLVGRLAHGFYGNIFSGPAAVIVFFVISGFCIHYPFAASARKPVILEFYTRRALRLLIPLAGALLFSKWVNADLSGIVWSLICELFYYAIYPALRLLHLRLHSWLVVILMAYGASLIVILTNPTAGNYPSYGWQLNWILGFPCWLLGCQLAENVRRHAAAHEPRPTIWLWRFGVASAAWLCSTLRFHSPIGYPWTLNLFALLAAAWVFAEIQHRKEYPAPGLLEWCGLWSYSLYLMHPSIGNVFGNLLPAISHPWGKWVLLILFVFAACYLFYLLVERPSHAAARHASRAFRPSRG